MIEDQRERSLEVSGPTIRFSVVLPLYNKEATVEHAVQSVLGQQVQDLELVVVDDGSTDGGPTLVEAMNDARLRLVRQQNQGVAAARNRGVSEARHELIAFLDADDEWLPGFLTTIRRMVERHPHCGAYAARYFLRASESERQAVIRGIGDGFEGILEDYFGVAVRSDPPVCSSAVCVRRSALQRVGMFPAGIAAGEDLLTWARIAKREAIAYSTKCQAIVNVASDAAHGFKKPRTAVDDNRVGMALEELARGAHRHRPALRRYSAFWYRIRAATYTAWGDRAAARRYSLRGLRCYPDVKLVAYLLATYLPRPAVSFLQNALRSH